MRSLASPALFTAAAQPSAGMDIGHLGKLLDFLQTRLAPTDFVEATQMLHASICPMFRQNRDAYVRQLRGA